MWVPQWHPGGHGLHAHFAVGRFVPRKLIERAWGHGFVHIKLLDGLPVGSGALGEARLAARYLARYVAANWRTSAGWRAAPLRGRAGLPAGQDRVLWRIGRGRDRARLRHMGGAGAGVALSGDGGVAWAARLLGAVGLTSCGTRASVGRTHLHCQGVPVKVADRCGRREVAELLLGLEAARTPPDRASGAQTGVEAVVAAPGRRADDDDGPARLRRSRAAG